MFRPPDAPMAGTLWESAGRVPADLPGRDHSHLRAADGHTLPLVLQGAGLPRVLQFGLDANGLRVLTLNPCAASRRTIR